MRISGNLAPSATASTMSRMMRRMTMPEIKLKPCPLCGTPATTSFLTVDLENRQQYGWLGCQSCGLDIRYYNLPGYYEKAAEKWNRRVSE